MRHVGMVPFGHARQIVPGNSTQDLPDGISGRPPLPAVFDVKGKEREGHRAETALSVKQHGGLYDKMTDGRQTCVSVSCCLVMRTEALSATLCKGYSRRMATAGMSLPTLFRAKDSLDCIVLVGRGFWTMGLQ